MKQGSLMVLNKINKDFHWILLKQQNSCPRASDIAARGRLFQPTPFIIYILTTFGHQCTESYIPFSHMSIIMQMKTGKGLLAGHWSLSHLRQCHLGISYLTPLILEHLMVVPQGTSPCHPTSADPRTLVFSKLGSFFLAKARRSPVLPSRPDMVIPTLLQKSWVVAAIVPRIAACHPACHSAFSCKLYAGRLLTNANHVI